MAELGIAGASVEGLAMISVVLEEAARRVAATGVEVRLVRGTFAPGSSRCSCLFEAPDSARVQRIAELAQVHVVRLEAVRELPVQIPC